MPSENQRVWPLVSVVFVTYKRVHLLERTVRAFRESTDYPTLELVVADDGSPKSVQEAIRKLDFDRFVLSAKNRGLGANLNAGLKEATGDYVFVLEDDWLCTGPADYLRRCVSFLEEKPNAEMVRFYGDAVSFVDEIQMVEKGSAYSNTPHLRTRRSLSTVGMYREDVWMEECERDYIRRFAAISGDTYMFRDLFNQTFQHIGEAESHRTRSARVRLRNWVSLAVSPIKRNFPQFFNAARAVIGRNR